MIADRKTFLKSFPHHKSSLFLFQIADCFLDPQLPLDVTTEFEELSFILISPGDDWRHFVNSAILDSHRTSRQTGSGAGHEDPYPPTTAGLLFYAKDLLTQVSFGLRSILSFSAAQKE